MQKKGNVRMLSHEFIKSNNSIQCKNKKIDKSTIKFNKYLEIQKCPNYKILQNIDSTMPNKSNCATKYTKARVSKLHKQHLDPVRSRYYLVKQFARIGKNFNECCND